MREFLSIMTNSWLGINQKNEYSMCSYFIIIPFISHCRDNLSPPLLVFNTSPLVIKGTHFFNNWPERVGEVVTSSTCYFSGEEGDTFFLDNRTSSGGLSHYSRSEPMELYIADCTFRNNSARPDTMVSLPRQLESYGHGGSMNIRLANSSNGHLCVKNSTFENNFAEAHAGAVSITIGGLSSQNNIEVTNCTFTNNSCHLSRCTGGAIGVDYFSDTSFNKLLINDSLFLQNSAPRGAGGAIALSTTVNVITGQNGESDSLVLQRCHFEKNQANYDGTALSAFSLTHTEQIGMPVYVTDW